MIDQGVRPHEVRRNGSRSGQEAPGSSRRAPSGSVIWASASAPSSSRSSTSTRYSEAPVSTPSMPGQSMTHWRVGRKRTRECNPPSSVAGDVRRTEPLGGSRTVSVDDHRGKGAPANPRHAAWRCRADDARCLGHGTRGEIRHLLFASPSPRSQRSAVARIAEAHASDITWQAIQRYEPAIDAEIYMDEGIARNEEEEAESEIDGTLWFLACLFARVDGLVVMAPDLSVRGFGAMITVEEERTRSSLRRSARWPIRTRAPVPRRVRGSTPIVDALLQRCSRKHRVRDLARR